MSVRTIEDSELEIDPKEFHIEHYGHQAYYKEHYCPKCEQESACTAKLCKLDFTVECLPCAQRELLEDTPRFIDEARQFLATALPTDDQTLMWWRALRSEVDGHLKGLAERAREIQKRMDREVKA